MPNHCRDGREAFLGRNTARQHTARQRRLYRSSSRAQPGTWYYPNAGVFLSSLTGARALLAQLRGLVTPNSSPDPIPAPSPDPGTKPKPSPKPEPRPKPLTRLVARGHFEDQAMVGLAMLQVSKCHAELCRVLQPCSSCNYSILHSVLTRLTPHILQEADGRIRVDANASLFSSQYAYNGKP